MNRLPFAVFMQTMPSFVYLIPAVFFFGLGKAPAVVATFIYAVPPCIRLTNLGIRQVAAEVVEAGKAFGTTPMQLLFKIQLPLARPSIMAGVNQTIMMALAMVVIASMIGASGLGLEVIIHELVHRKEMNHTKRFWELVAEHCPRWREHKSTLNSR